MELAIPPIIGQILTIGYILTLILILGYSLLQFDLLILYLKNQRRRKPAPPPPPAIWPAVTIQLPLYNEPLVVDRLIHAICALDYPRDRLRIQVLDDSTDNTSTRVGALVKHYQERGFLISHLRRTHRTGYKAGALQAGLQQTQDTFIAIFDADFLPEPCFLKRTIPYLLENERLAVVQARWRHLNDQYSLLTRWQAHQLNLHFRVEQTARASGNLFLQFNGTAGIWRKEAIQEAGGWQPDTLTEDLDLSYRVQLRGWQMEYLESVTAPAEVPVEIDAYKAQQYRWMKGGAETARKLLPVLWRADLPLRLKLHGSYHLLGSSVFLLILFLALTSLPLIWLFDMGRIPQSALHIFGFALLTYFTIFLVANRPDQETPQPWWRLILFFPVFLSLSMALCLHNSRAVWHGWNRKPTIFQRTPKYNIQSRQPSSALAHSPRSRDWLNTLEILAALTFALAFGAGLASGQMMFLVFHALLTAGFSLLIFFRLSVPLLRARS